MLEYPHNHSRTMINLDERYHSYLDGRKKMRIDGVEERVKAYGWHCDGSDIDWNAGLGFKVFVIRLWS